MTRQITEFNVALHDSDDQRSRSQCAKILSPSVAIVPAVATILPAYIIGKF